MEGSGASSLDQRQHLGPEFLHRPENLVGRRPAEAEIEAADADVAQRADIGGKLRRLAREQAMFAIAGLRWRGLAEHRDAQGQADRLGIAAGLSDPLAKAG